MQSAVRRAFLFLILSLSIPLLLAASIRLTVYDGGGTARGTTSATLTCDASGNPAVSTSLTISASSCTANCPSSEGVWRARGTYSGGLFCNGKRIPGNTPVTSGPAQFNPGPGWDDYCDCTPPGTPSLAADSAWHRDSFTTSVSYTDNHRVYQVLYGVGLASTTVTPSTAKACSSTTSRSCTASFTIGVPNPCNIEGKNTCKSVTRAKDFWQWRSSGKGTEYYNIDLSPPETMHAWQSAVYTDKRGPWYNATSGAGYTLTCQDTYSGCDGIQREDRYASCSSTPLRDDVNTLGTKYGGGTASVTHTITNCNTQRCDRRVCYRSDDNAISHPGNQDPVKASSTVLLDGLPPESTILSSIQGGSSGTCGDGICNKPSETSTSCPSDCRVNEGTGDPTPTNSCGNGICETSRGESPSSCVADCGYCGDGICNNGETSTSCREDCPPSSPSTGGGFTTPGGDTGDSGLPGGGSSPPSGGSSTPTCGNGIVEQGEECDPPESPCNPPYEGSCMYCSAACTLVRVWGPSCGDGTCQTQYEDCSSCPGDCGSCPPSGGGGICPAVDVLTENGWEDRGSFLKGAFLKQLAMRDYHPLGPAGNIKALRIREPDMLDEVSHLRELRLIALTPPPNMKSGIDMNGIPFSYNPTTLRHVTPLREEEVDGLVRTTYSLDPGSVMIIQTSLSRDVRERAFRHLSRKLISPHAYAFEPLISRETAEALAQPFLLTLSVNGKPLTVPLVERVSEGEPLYLTLPKGGLVEIERLEQFYPSLKVYEARLAPPPRVEETLLTTNRVVTEESPLILPLSQQPDNAFLYLAAEGYYHYGEYALQNGQAYTDDTTAFTTLLKLLSNADRTPQHLAQLYLGVSDP